MMNFEELIEKTKKLNKEFEKRARVMDRRDRMIDLMEELGELAQAVLIVDGRKLTRDPKKQRTIKHIADGLCDVMFDLILLADDYKLDLEKEYEKMLERLKARLDEGEFDKEGKVVE